MGMTCDMCKEQAHKVTLFDFDDIVYAVCPNCVDAAVRSHLMIMGAWR